MAALTDLQLLGEFALRAGSRIVLDETWKRGRAKSLLKLVALAPGHRLHREQVTEALWPELDPEAALHQLYKSLHLLKAEMASFGLPSPLGIVEQHVSLDAAIDVDTDRFRRLAGLARGADTDRHRVAEAIAAYSGELLRSDRLDEWTTVPREELARLHRELLVELSRLEHAQGDDRAAIAALRQVLESDVTDENAHRALMRLFASTGDRGQAIRQYHACRDALQRELDVDPSPDTEELHRSILEECVASAADMGPARATLVEELADAMRRSGDLEHSTPLNEQAMGIFEAAGDPHGALRVGGKAALSGRSRRPSRRPRPQATSAPWPCASTLSAPSTSS